MKRSISLCLILAYTLPSVVCNIECVTYNFEKDDFNTHDPDKGLYSDIPNTWVRDSYASLGIDPFNGTGSMFIYPKHPPSQESFISSPPFLMRKGGFADMLVYTENVQVGDRIDFRIEAEQDKSKWLMTHPIHSPSTPGFVSGWRNLRINMNILPAEGAFGYIILRGAKTKNSTVLVDSIRYIPPSANEEDCIIYENEDKLTTISTSTKSGVTSSSTATWLTTETNAVRDVECVTHNFEDGDFDIHGSDKGLCTHIPNLWALDSYDLLGIEPLNSTSSKFIYPKHPARQVCLNSPNFLMRNGGFVETLVYIDNAQNEDYIVLRVEAVSNRVNFWRSITYYRAHPLFIAGWQTLRLNMTLLPDDGAIGFIALTGFKTENTTLFIDSYRYVPPSANEKDCRVYDEKDDVLTTVAAATEPWVMTTAEVSSTVTELTTTTEISPVRDVECVTHNFEEGDFDLHGSDKGLCYNTPNLWALDSYASLGIQPINSTSLMFIYPKHPARHASCVNSPYFVMRSGGFVEVLVYTENAQRDDLLILRIEAVDPEVYFWRSIMYSTASPHFVEGWQILRLDTSLLPEKGALGYVTLMGVKTENSIMLVDSYRYVPPSTNEEECRVYEDVLTTVPPITIVTDETSSKVTEVPTTVVTTDGSSTITELPGGTTSSDNNNDTTPGTDEGGDDSSSSESSESSETEEDDTSPSVTPKPNPPSGVKSFWVKMKLKLKMHLKVFMD